LTKPDLDSAQTAFDANAARIASSLAQIELARIGLRDTLLVAPRRGIILERKIEIGSLVAGGSIGFLIGDVSTVKALFGVPDSVVHRLTLGRPLAVTTEAFRGETFAGPITAISPSADAQSRVFDVEITIANRSGRLRPGMIGGVDVPSGSAAAPDGRVPAVPLSAIVRSEKHPDEYSVLVVSESDQKTSARSRAVTLGAVEGNLVSVTAGLMAGERVVMMGATLLTDGEIVRVIP
jgi:RND family efflux transporter MFP subunit